MFNKDAPPDLPIGITQTLRHLQQTLARTHNAFVPAASPPSQHETHRIPLSNIQPNTIIHPSNSAFPSQPKEVSTVFATISSNSESRTSPSPPSQAEYVLQLMRLVATQGSAGPESSPSPPKDERDEKPECTGPLVRDEVRNAMPPIFARLRSSLIADENRQRMEMEECAEGGLDAIREAFELLLRSERRMAHATQLNSEKLALFEKRIHLLTAESIVADRKLKERENQLLGMREELSAKEAAHNLQLKDAERNVAEGQKKIRVTERKLKRELALGVQRDSSLLELQTALHELERDHAEVQLLVASRVSKETNTSASSVSNTNISDAKVEKGEADRDHVKRDSPTLRLAKANKLIDQLNAQIKHLQSQLENKTSIIESLKQNAERNISVIEELTARNNHYHEKCTTLEIQYGEKQALCKVMKAQLESVASAKGDTERLAREVGKLRGQLAFYQKGGGRHDSKSNFSRRSSSAAPSLMAQSSANTSENGEATQKNRPLLPHSKATAPVVHDRVIGSGTNTFQPQSNVAPKVRNPRATHDTFSRNNNPSADGSGSDSDTLSFLLS